MAVYPVFLRKPPVFGAAVSAVTAVASDGQVQALTVVTERAKSAVALAV